MDSGNSATEFATIDELLDGDEDDDEEEEEEAVVDPQAKEAESCPSEPIVDLVDELLEEEPEVIDDDPAFERDRADDDVKEEVEDADVKEEVEEVKKVADFPPLDAAKMNIFCSSLLEDAIKQELHGAATIPPNSAMEGISELSSNAIKDIKRKLDEREFREGLKAGLGLKKRAADQVVRMGGGVVIVASKAKTLAEKRKKMHEDMMKYGVAAVERLYPRQNKIVPNVKKMSRPPKLASMFKLKPAPAETTYEEVEARSIIRPYSHHKYIQEPLLDTVVFINRRDGLVPLSSLCKHSKTVLSSNVSLVAGRNVSMGKPSCYVRDKNRLVAVGGSRHRIAAPDGTPVSGTAIRIVGVPRLSVRRQALPLFDIDAEYAEFAARALSFKKPRVDIRKLKQLEKTQQRQLEARIDQEKSLVERVRLKLQLKKEMEKEAQNPTDHPADDTLGNMTESQPVEAEAESNKDEELSANQRTEEEKEEGPSEEKKEKGEEQENEKKIDGDKREEPAVLVIKNAWKDLAGTPAAFPTQLNMDECPPLRGFEEGSIQPILRTPRITNEGLTGWETCDVSGCCCKSSKETSRVASPVMGAATTGSQSGSQTPSATKRPPPEEGGRKIAKDLKRVKRALKRLGVNIIEYDEHGFDGEDCLREHCKFGCICDSIRMRPLPPAHCGKVDCMFECSCSKEALKYSSCSSRRVNISAAVGARIQEDSQRHMAVEERKFTNTVVVTASRDTLLLGGRSTRRERKVPQRYQNSSTLMLDVAGKEYVAKASGTAGGEQEEEQQEEQQEEQHELEEEDEEEQEIEMELGMRGVVGNYSDLMKKMDIIACTVIIPKVDLPASTEVWCMYHCTYSCPCHTYRNPLDYAPDRGPGRNVAKRSIGARFLTRKRSRSEEREEVMEVDNEAVEELIRSDDDDEPKLSEPIDSDYEPEEGGSETRKPSKSRRLSEEKSKVLSSASQPPGKAAKRRKSKLFRLRKSGSSRTNGAAPKEPGARIRLPYTQASKEVREEVEFVEVASADSQSAAPRTLSSSPETKLDLSKYTSFGRIVDVQGGITQKTKTDSTNFSLAPAPRGSYQYVRWDILKQQYISGEVNIWFHLKPGRQVAMLFLSSRGQKSYIASAINIRNVHGGTNKLPSLVEECLQPLDDQKDRSSYAVLESNGLVWTLSSLLSNRKLAAGAAQQRQQLKKVGEKTAAAPSAPSPATTNAPAVPSSSPGARINIQNMTQKLPAGQSLITVHDGPRAIMQVKLPATQSYQHWTLVSVGNGRPTISCPDSPLVLKCAILQQAATLASATSTTVRIPIPVDNQDPSFGVYAVPGLKTHVFVGPFAIRSVERSNKGESNDDDDCVVLEDDVKEQEDILIEEKSGKEKEDDDIEIKEDLEHQAKLLGQVPQVLAKDEGDLDIDILSISDGPGSKESVKLKASMISEVKKTTIPINLQLSKYGKVVRRSAANQEQNGGHVITLKHVLKTEEKQYRCRIDPPTGRVRFPHPQQPAEYEVICSSLAKTKLWLKYYHRTSERQLPTESDVKEVVDKESYPPVVRIIPEPNSSQLPDSHQLSPYGVLVEAKRKKQESTLFYELGHTAYNSFKKNLTKGQILHKAKEEVEQLKKDSLDLEKTKQELFRKRSQLFESFINCLEGVPVAYKKAAVVELKAVLNNIANKKPDEPQTKPDSQKDVHTEDPQSQQEEQQQQATPSAVVAVDSPTPYTDATGIQTLRPDGSVLRPMNAFMLWSKEKRAALLAQGLSIKEVGQHLAEAWKNTSEAEKSAMHSEAERLKILHGIQHPGYKFQPKQNPATTEQPSDPSSSSQPPGSAVIISKRPPAIVASVPLPAATASSTVGSAVSAARQRLQPVLHPRTTMARPAPPALIPLASIGIASEGQQQSRRVSLGEAVKTSLPGGISVSRPSSHRPRSTSVFLPASGSRERTLSLSDIPQDAAQVLGLLAPASQPQQGHHVSGNARGLTSDVVLVADLHPQFQTSRSRKRSSAQQQHEVVTITDDFQPYNPSEGGEEIILDSELDDQQHQVILQQQPRVILQPQRQQSRVILQPQRQQSRVFLPPEQQPVILQSDQQVAGDYIFVDENGQQVIFEEQGDAQEYYMQDGDLIEVIDDDADPEVTTID